MFIHYDTGFFLSILQVDKEKKQVCSNFSVFTHHQCNKHFEELKKWDLRAVLLQYTFNVK